MSLYVLRVKPRSVIATIFIHAPITDTLQIMEKNIASQLKWDLNAVTTSEFIEELSSRLTGLVTSDELEKIIDHAHTISNVCLLCKCTVHYIAAVCCLV